MTKVLKQSFAGQEAEVSEDSITLAKLDGYLHLPSNSRLPSNTRLLASNKTLASRPALFLDRDGVLVEDVHFLTDANQLRLLPGVPEALSVLQDRFFVIVVTNQSGIARGYLTEDELLTVHTEMLRLLALEGATVDALYYCPHLPEATVPEYGIRCDCRKPGPAMLLRAANQWDIDLPQSFLVGDSPRDIEAAHSAGVKGIMVNREGSEMDQNAPVVRDLAAAIDLII